MSKKAVEGVINKIFCSKSNDTEIPVDVLIFSLIKELKSDEELSQEQKNKLGEHIFFNLDVIKQLEKSDVEPDNEYVSNYDDYLKFKNEVANESR